MTKKRRNKSQVRYNTTELAKQHARKQNLDNIAELIDTAKELSKTFESSGKEWLVNHEIDVDKFIGFYNSVNGDFDDLKPDKLKILWDTAFGTKCNKFLEDYRTNANADVSDGVLEKEFMKNAFAEWKPAADSISRIDEIEDDYNTCVNENAEHYTRKEFDLSRQETIIKLEKRLTSMEAFGADGRDIKMMRRCIRVMNERFSPDYIFDEYKDDKAARDRIVDAFFNDKRSNYIMHRFYDRCNQIKLQPDVLRLMINLEESYLEEKYHVFNNFYIFTLMNFAVYHVTRKEVSREIKYPVQCVLNLVYNKFYSEDVKNVFLDHLRRFFDIFEQYRDLFNTSNQLHPKHPYRIKKDAERTAAFKTTVLGKMASEFPQEFQRLTESGDDVRMTSSEIQEYYLKLCDERETIEQMVENADSSDIVTSITYTKVPVNVKQSIIKPESLPKRIPTNVTYYDEGFSEALEKISDNTKSENIAKTKGEKPELGRGLTSPIIHTVDPVVGTGLNCDSRCKLAPFDPFECC